MNKLTIEEITARIRKGNTFEASPPDQSFTIKITEYIPFVCVALHAGHKMREDLVDNCLLSDHERWYEEDPYTDQFIRSFPIVLIANDSRYEYDLNRPPEEAIYDIAWEKKVWDDPLTDDQKAASLKKHTGFYQVIDALMQRLKHQFGSALVFDIHSYNYKRYNRLLPVFNLGTDKVDTVKYNKTIYHWVKELKKIDLPDVATTVAINDIFYGHGYMLQHISARYPDILVLATEIKKVYCNELTGDSYPLVIEALTQGLKNAILNSARFFAKKYTNINVQRNERLLSSEISKELLTLDKQLFGLVKNFEILSYINPVNLEYEKRKFFRSRFTKNPEFRYRQLAIDPFEFKRKLYQLPIEKIRDINIQMLYKDVVNAYADKVDLIAAIGSQRFLYSSLRYFGEPSERDISNAVFLLHCPDLKLNHERKFTVQEAKAWFENAVKEYGFQCKVDIASNIASKVLVLNSKRTIKLRKGTVFPEIGLNALLHHEIGVHMVTTMNALHQPLNLLRMGLPVNTLTQEGLAILSEYLSDNLTVFRLKELALRVLTIKNMLNGYDFKHAFEYLVDGGLLNEEAAFYMAARIFRGGGFTKDYLYLKGFRYILNFYADGNSLENMLVGKTSLAHLPVIDELIERRILLPPKYKTKAFEHPVTRNLTMKYLVNAIRSV